MENNIVCAGQKGDSAPLDGCCIFFLNFRPPNMVSPEINCTRELTDTSCVGLKGDLLTFLCEDEQQLVGNRRTP